eukprot:2157543-Pleurochrysis_carterae.AAC.2
MRGSELAVTGASVWLFARMMRAMCRRRGGSVSSSAGVGFSALAAVVMSTCPCDRAFCLLTRAPFLRVRSCMCASVRACSCRFPRAY